MLKLHRNVGKLYAMKVARTVWERGKSRGINIGALPILIIKEGKLGLSFDKMSSTEFIANANKLQEMVLAYNFNNWFRNLCLDKTPMKDMTIETIRTKLVKIAAKIVKGGRYLKFKLCSSCPYKEDFFNILNRIAYIPI